MMFLETVQKNYGKAREYSKEFFQRYRDEFSESVYRNWTAGATEEQAREALLGAYQTAPKWRFRTHLLPRDYDIFGNESGTDHLPILGKSNSRVTVFLSATVNALSLRTDEQFISYRRRL